MKTTFVTNITGLLLLASLIAPASHAATIKVTTNADSGPGSLRAGLAGASNGDLIDATGISGTILLTSGNLLVTNNVSILGPGPRHLAVDGNAAGRVFYVGQSNTVSISGFAITNGFVTGWDFPSDRGGGILLDHATLTVSNCTLNGNLSIYSTNIQGSGQFYGLGGGIFNLQGTLALSDCTLVGNVAGNGSGGGDYTGHGGGIFNFGTLALTNCIFSANSANDAGGGIYNEGMLTALNLTISSNSADFRGGGIFNEGGSGATPPTTAILVNCTLDGNSVPSGSGGAIDNEASTLRIANSTISSNSASVSGAGIWNEDIFGGDAIVMVVNSTFSGNSAPGGGAIANDVTPYYSNSVTLQIGSTILNAGGSGPNITNSSGVVTSLGYNLSSDDAGGLLNAPGDRINTDPMLGPLQNNGGPTWTHALSLGSPAIDMGKNLSGSAYDQRGQPFARTYDDPALPNASGGDGTDIGAFEVQARVPCNLVTTTDDSGPGSLRAALACAPSGATIDATGVSGTILLTSGELLVTANMTILGPGPDKLTVDGNGSSRVFHINNGLTATIASLGIANGFAPGLSGPGGLGAGVYNDHSTLTLSNIVLKGNSAGIFGGAVYNDGYIGGAQLVLVDCTLSGNSALSGGAVATTVDASLEVNRCSLSANSATASDGGGALYNDGSTVILDSTLSNNFGGGEGGAIYNQDCPLVVSNSTFIGNSTLGDGGAIFNFADSRRTGSVAVANCTLSGNTSFSGGALYNSTCCAGVASFQIVGSTFIANAAMEGSAVYNSGADGGTATILLVNSTLSGNIATNTGAGVWNDAGFNYPGVGKVALLNCTLNDNLAGTGAGIENSTYNSNATVEIGSTILKGSSPGGNITRSGGIISDGYNLSSDDGGGFLTNVTDLINTDPMLGPLQNNGGPTFTHALLCGSPAIDQGRNFTDSATDQRGVGFARTFDNAGVPNPPGGDGTDIGAFEVQTVCSTTQAVERLVALVREKARRPQTLLATLHAVIASINRDNPTSAVNQLRAFQHKVQAQVAPSDPELAQIFIQATHDIIEQLSPASTHGPRPNRK